MVNKFFMLPFSKCYKERFNNKFLKKKYIIIIIILIIILYLGSGFYNSPRAKNIYLLFQYNLCLRHYKAINKNSIFYMQRKIKMAKTCKLVFALILFASLYLVSMSAECKLFFFILFKFHFLRCCLYKIFCLVLLTLVYCLYSLQWVVHVAVMRNVHNSL